MSASATGSDGTHRCSRCRAPLSSSIDGLCAACLMRLASFDAGEDVDDEPPPGAQRIGRYELIEELARGGMGIVYRAQQLGASRVVALKLMLPHLLNLPGMLQRFRQEAEAAARLDHPGILPIYEVGEHGGLPFFSMKLAEGGSLEARLESHAGDWMRIAKLVAQVALAVDHAHERGVLHRDLKPANILFDGENRPLVADFGLAKIVSPDRTLTIASAALGSPHYMAPEQASAQFGDVGRGTDVYSLGAILYALLTGRPPIVGHDAVETIRLLPGEPVLPGVQRRADIPPALDAIALKCLKKRPEERYASAAALAADLEAWIAGRAPAAQRQVIARRYRTWAVGWVVALLVLTAGAGGSHVWQRIATSDSSQPSAARVSTGPKSIAVLPFRNVSAAARDDFLRSSVTDDLMRDLRQIESLSVVPFRIGEDEALTLTTKDVYERLGVDVVLEGDFRRSGNRLTVEARLLDARTGSTLWRQQFDILDGDIREMRSQIANGLVTQLQIRIGTDLRASFSPNAPTASSAAYADYLQARYLTRWRRHATLTEAATLLRRAIAQDPQFARAYSALAYVYELWIEEEPPEGDHWELAFQFAQQALTLDPSLSEPHAVLGDYYSIFGRYAEADGEFRKAAELDPRDPATLHLYAIHLYAMGYLRKALEYERRSVALDSTSPQPMMWLAVMTTTLGSPGDARRIWEKTDQLGAARPYCAAVSRTQLGEFEPFAEWERTRAVAEAQVPAEFRNSEVLVAGMRDAASRGPGLQLLRNVEARADPAFLIAQYSLFDDADGAYRVARTFKLVDDVWYFYQLCNIWSPRTASLRRDARFSELMEKWGFVQYWRRFGEPDLCSLSGKGVSCR